MTEICIYCGVNVATERDHAPPKCFFPPPRPDNMITVPSCEECNRKFGKDDERVRNLLISLDTTELHKAIKNHLALKRNRSLIRQKGRTNFQHILRSMKFVERYSKGGIYLGKAPAFNLDQDVMDRFLERMTRALIYHDNSIGYVNCDIKWRMSLSPEQFESMPTRMKQFLSSGKFQEIGDNIFKYIGLFYPGKANSLWLLNLVID